jgi:SAM-dependent methyltransferase
MSTVPRIFDHRLLAAHEARARRLAVPGSDFLLARAVGELVERLAAVNRRFASAAVIGARGTDFAAALADHVDAARFVDIFGDGERLALDEGSIDLAMSALSLQWVNDLPGLLVQIRRALAPDGLLLAVLAGGDTLAELRDVLAAAESDLRGGAAPRVAPFADLRDIGALLQRAGFALPVVDTERVTVRYDTMFDLIRDLRAMGATSILTERDPRPLTRMIAARAATLYAERHADRDGRIRATFELVSMSAWVPHESQQKPLRPGSAKMRLSDAVEAARRTKPSDPPVRR